MPYCSISLYLDKENKVVGFILYVFFNCTFKLQYSQCCLYTEACLFLWEKTELLKKPEKKPDFFSFLELHFHKGLVFAKPLL